MVCRITQEPYDTDKMSVEFRNQFPVMALAKGQDLIFNFQSKPNLKLTVKALVGNVPHSPPLISLLDKH